ncbi:hypothetical protein AVEN_16889-1 [Araneus ventricosus]|uniref:Uncharacterized protein n=1 Tax=Araneus ventricosus TaxID=182803 RepID=A0A4Y2K5R4_ARAVE|nr:hypothetical protein AVEN_16889-1 [Araneus ventricosus]
MDKPCRNSPAPTRNGARVCPTVGHDLPDRGDECNEIGLKFSPDYYLSTTVEYPVQKFSPTEYKNFPRRVGGTASPTGGPDLPDPPSGANPGPNHWTNSDNLFFHLKDYDI